MHTAFTRYNRTRTRDGTFSTALNRLRIFFWSKAYSSNLSSTPKERRIRARFALFCMASAAAALRASSRSIASSPDTGAAPLAGSTSESDASESPQPVTSLKVHLTNPRVSSKKSQCFSASALERSSRCIRSGRFLYQKSLQNVSPSLGWSSSLPWTTFTEDTPAAKAPTLSPKFAKVSLFTASIATSKNRRLPLALDSRISLGSAVESTYSSLQVNCSNSCDKALRPPALSSAVLCCFLNCINSSSVFCLNWLWTRASSFA
mmetsp:Transcript_76777/g.234951  ORF Transcript_76777/g.234951 Transcript_76777/m.234951 type:complete len:262 (-) Transcript_76777:468-1253(-)